MYTAFYGLREKPFALSPDPRFLYLAGSHREALAHLIYGIEQGEGFISVTGEVGTGKTTLCRTLLERLDGDTELAFLFNPSRTALELLQSICAEFDLPEEGLTRRSLMTQLDAFLVAQKQLGRRVLLIIDEAQTLSETTLEQVRLLSNLETSREKLIQILLLGQPELDRKLDGRGLRQLRQRISVRWKLAPLGPEETRAYVRHRLSVAAGKPTELFSESALREIHRRTSGVPRLVNQLCDRALLAGYAARAALIRPNLIRAAASEIPDARLDREFDSLPRSFLRPRVFLGSSFALIGLALFAGLQVGRHDLTNLMRFSSDPQVAVGAISPTVGANVVPASAEPLAVPPVARLMGYIPPEEASRLGIERTAATKEGRSEDVAASIASIPIPDAPAPKLAALAPGLLPSLLANRDPQRAMVESQRAILAEFGRRFPILTPSPHTAEDLQAGIEDGGLTATPFDGGSIDLIRQLDHPVLLSLAPTPNIGGAPRTSIDDRSEERWLAVTGFSGDRARVDGLIANRSVTVPVEELAAHWLEKGIIVWEQYDPMPNLVVSGDEGASVLWLQRALAELGFFKGQPNGSFDARTFAALVHFQRQHGLVADGMAGPLSKIALYGQLDRYPVPRLSRGNGPPSLAPEAPATAGSSESTSVETSTEFPTPEQAEASPRAGDRG